LPAMRKTFFSKRGHDYPSTHTHKINHTFARNAENVFLAKGPCLSILAHTKIQSKQLPVLLAASAVVINVNFIIAH